MAYYVSEVEQLLSLVKRIRPEERSFLLVICGPPLSGKTYLANALLRGFERLRISIPLVGGKPFLVSEGEFLRGDLRKFLEITGGMFLHPRVVDVDSLKTFVDRLLSGNPVSYIEAVAGDGEVGRKEVEVFPPEKGVVVVEGTFACENLKDLADLLVFVEVPSSLELILRRVVRVAYGLGAEEALSYASYSQVLWELFGKDQRKLADVIYLNTYRVLEDIGREDYQVKVCVDDFARRLPETFERLRSSTPLYMEDVVVTEGMERIRGRLIYRGDIPETFEISYRRFVPDRFPYIRRMTYTFPPRLFLPFVSALASAKLGYKLVKREVSWIEEDGVKFKLYPDRGVVEIETTDRSGMERFVDLFRGHLLFKSYYTSDRMCG